MFYPQYQNYPQYPYPQYQNNAQAAPPQISAPISVRAEKEARDWPIAPGNSLTFIDESAGYVYTKTSLNQFDRPKFVKYRLVREDAAEAANDSQQDSKTYALQSDVDAISGAVKEIKSELEHVRARLTDAGNGKED